MNEKPLVSVIIPAYNAGLFLRQAINSILNQSYRNFELIIVDDASTDNSWEIISSFKRQYSKKIKVVKLPQNLNRGGDVAGNIGLNLAKGEFVARMDADDIAMPDRLEKQVSFLLTNPEIFAVGSNAHVINKDGYLIGEKKMPLDNENIYREFFVFHPLIHPTLMFRRSAIKRKNLYKIEYQANNDYLTFFEMITKGYRFANLPEKLLCYRFHGKNDSLVKVKSKFFNSLKIRLQAVREFGYKPNLMSIFKLLAQVIIVLILPEKVIVPLYLVIRGISRPNFAKLDKGVRYAFNQTTGF
jgi:glycosyltransferase involved in cell wall biosynthesis